MMIRHGFPRRCSGSRAAVAVSPLYLMAALRRIGTPAGPSAKPTSASPDAADAAPQTSAHPEGAAGVESIWRKPSAIPTPAAAAASATAPSTEGQEALVKAAASGDVATTTAPRHIIESDPMRAPGSQPDAIERYGPVSIDRGPTRHTGLWTVKDTEDAERGTVDFRKIDELDTAAREVLLNQRDDALVSVDDEEKHKHRLMFVHKFEKTPKHLTWKEMSQEIDSLDCEIDLDPHRPEEVYRMTFFFVHKASRTRNPVWTATNDISHSEGLTDLLAAVGSCLGRADVHRTIRFDDGQGTTRDMNIRKNSRYTSEVVLAFRPSTNYDIYTRTEAQDEWETQLDAQGVSSWGFHPGLMDPEYRDVEDPVGTSHIHLSAHAFSFVVLRAIERLVSRPLKDFYRPSQIARTVKVSKEEDIGLTRAVMGWVGFDDQLYPHMTPIDAVQDHWLGADAPFTLVAMMNKIREMTYLKPRNPEFQSWLSVRHRETAIAARNVRAKLLGVGASRLFVPLSYDATVNRLLPKPQQRIIKANVSVAAVLGMPDETRRLDEYKRLTAAHKLEEGTAASTQSESAAPGGSSGDPASASTAERRKDK